MERRCAFLRTVSLMALSVALLSCAAATQQSAVRTKTNFDEVWRACLDAVVDLEDTRLLREPALSSDRIAFVYDADLWVARHDGRQARRLTTARGQASASIASSSSS